jgi:glutamate dehydrogenase
MTVKQRNRLLEEMTDEVADLVLVDNYGQTQAISLVLCRAPNLLDEHERLIGQLERAERLDRALEFLPDEKGLVERRNGGRGLVGPELAVLLAYSKMTLYDELVASDVPEDPFLSRELQGYFPRRLGETFDAEMQRHRLRREIIATHVTNSLVNRLGPSFPFRLREETGSSYGDVARAFATARAIFDMDALWADIEGLDNRVAAEIQYDAMNLVNGLVERTMLWLLRSRRGSIDIASTVDTFRDGVLELSAALPKPLSAPGRLSMNRRTRFYTAEKVPQELAHRIAAVVPLSSALDIVEVARGCDRDPATVATVYFALGERLELQWLREQIGSLDARSHWHRLAKSALRHDVHTQQRNLTAEAIAKSRRGERVRNLVDAWIASNQLGYDRYMQVTCDLKNSGSVDFAMLSVALSEVHLLLDGSGTREN